MVARELGSARLEARAKIIVNILDVNDHAPTFARANYKAEVMEDAAPGTVIMKVIKSLIGFFSHKYINKLFSFTLNLMVLSLYQQR